MSVNGKTFAVTGATSGIGWATSLLLAKKGANVVAVGRRESRLQDLTDQAEGKIHGVRVDVRKAADCGQILTEAVSKFHGLDGIVCNAGNGAYGPLEELSDDDVQSIIDTNLTGSIWSIRAVLPHMLEAKTGDIVLVSSVAGIVGGRRQAVYAAAKFGQVGLARSLDLDLRERGIRVGVVCPGGVRTEFAMGRGRTPSSPALADMLAAEEVAETIVAMLELPPTVRTRLSWIGSMAEGD